MFNHSVQFHYIRFSPLWAVTSGLRPPHLSSLAPWTTRLLSQWMLRWWRVNDSHGRPQKLLQWRQSRHFAHPFQAANDAMQMEVHETLYLFYRTSKGPIVSATITKCALLAAIARYITIIYTTGYLQIFKAGYFFSRKHYYGMRKPQITNRSCKRSCPNGGITLSITVIARTKSTDRKVAADFRFSTIFCSLIPIFRGGQMAVLPPLWLAAHSTTCHSQHTQQLSKIFLVDAHGSTARKLFLCTHPSTLSTGQSVSTVLQFLSVTRPGIEPRPPDSVACAQLTVLLNRSIIDRCKLKKNLQWLTWCDMAIMSFSERLPSAFYEVRFLLGLSNLLFYLLYPPPVPVGTPLHHGWKWQGALSPFWWWRPHQPQSLLPQGQFVTGKMRFALVCIKAVSGHIHKLRLIMINHSSIMTSPHM